MICPKCMKEVDSTYFSGTPCRNCGNKFDGNKFYLILFTIQQAASVIGNSILSIILIIFTLLMFFCACSLFYGSLQQLFK